MRNGYSCMIIHYASQNGYKRLVELIIREYSITINVDVCCYYGWTALMYASCNGHTDTAKFLIKYGANVNMVSYEIYRKTPLICASYNGHTEVVKLLIKKGANVNMTGCVGYDNRVYNRANIKLSPLICAISNEDMDIVKLLIKNGAKVNVSNNNNDTPLSLAIQKGNKHINKLILDAHMY